MVIATSILSVLAVAPIILISAADTIEFLQGDVDGNGQTDLCDLTFIQKYLKGMMIANQNIITRMDSTDDKLIDYQDFNRILDYNLDVYDPELVSRKVLSSINDEKRDYYVKNCLTGEIDDYTLELPLSSKKMINISSKSSTSLNYIKDNENLNVVKLITSSGDSTGFIISPHVVATCAHSIYDNNSFDENIQISIIDDKDALSSLGSEIKCKSFKAKYAHIPKLYTDPKNPNIELYDYALLYFDDNLELALNEFDSNIWQIGYVTDEYIKDSNTIYTSGFVGYENPLFTLRYYNSGNLNKNYINPYRLEAYAKIRKGNSGGPFYYKNNTNVKSAIGICTHRDNAYNPTKMLGCRMTPTLARFYYNNRNLQGVVK